MFKMYVGEQEHLTVKHFEGKKKKKTHCECKFDLIFFFKHIF
jgi:hypothetical protein